MHQYPKQILTIPQQIQTYIDSGMEIPSQEEAIEALTTIGYYRLRGYCYHMYDNNTKQYQPGTRFTDVVLLYRFDSELVRLLFSFLSLIEVSLRVRLTEALLTYNDALILNDPVVFDDKKIYWRNQSTIATEIARSNDVFIKHNFENHDGEIPVWAIVEVMSFGTLSKIIKNLKTGSNSAYSVLADFYKYETPNGNTAKPTKKMLSSWVHAATVLRNLCAHNSRVYNRALTTAPELIAADVVTPKPRYNGLYQMLMAMKYLRPTDREWNAFVKELKNLVQEYNTVLDLNRMNFPADWEVHITI